MLSVTNATLAAECLRLHVYKTGNTTGPVVPHSVPTGGTTLSPHVIQGHGQLAESPLHDKLFVIIMHLVIHQAFGKQRRKAECKQKKAEQGTRNGKIKQKCFWGKRSDTKTDAGAARCTFFKRQLPSRDINQRFTDLNPPGLLIIEQF